MLYRTPVIIRKISPDRANWTPTRSVVLPRPEGIIFNNDRWRSINYPAYYTAPCQNETIPCKNETKVKKDVNQARNPLSLTAVKFGVHKSTDGVDQLRTTAAAQLKSSRSHLKLIGISVYMLWRTKPLFRTELYFLRELYSDWAVLPLLFGSDVSM
jgi:hypothetical protein